MQFSMEVTPKVDVSQIPKGVREVSITYLPGADYRDVVAQAVRLRQLRFAPIPHIPARSLRSRQELADFITALRQDAQVSQVLLIGGSLERPAGPYAASLDVLETGLLDGLRVGVAGHPEGMPHLSEQACDRILALKNQYARDMGTDLFIMTQWALEVEAIVRWLDRIQPFNDLPIYLGIPGPTTPTSLLKFAKICGVRASLLGLRQQSSRLGQLLTVQTPDYLIDALAPRVDHFHLYTFGGIKRTRDWLTQRTSLLTPA